jgi:hypothetical protein
VSIIGGIAAMTPEERKLVIELFDRLATLEDVQRDPEAERLVKDGLRQAPNAPYALVQTVLVQDEALKRANARLRELESANEATAQDTSFLGTMRDTLFGTQERRGSVPSVRSDQGSPAAASGMSPVWRTGPQQAASGWAPGAAAAAPFSAGGSFLGTAASAAAGVIGGALLLDGIRSMMGHQGGAHAAFDPHAGGSSPWGGDNAGDALSREAGLDDIGRPARVLDTDRGYPLATDGGREDLNSDLDVDDDDLDDDTSGGEEV